MEIRSNNKDRFSELSILSHEQLMNRNYIDYVKTIEQIGDILYCEGCYLDAFKMFFLAFHTGINISPSIGLNESIANKIVEIMNGHVDWYEARQMCLDCIKEDSTPEHFTSVDDSLYLIRLFNEGKSDEAHSLFVSSIYHTIL